MISHQDMENLYLHFDSVGVFDAKSRNEDADMSPRASFFLGSWLTTLRRRLSTPSVDFCMYSSLILYRFPG